MKVAHTIDVPKGAVQEVVVRPDGKMAYVFLRFQREGCSDSYFRLAGSHAH